MNTEADPRDQPPADGEPRTPRIGDRVRFRDSCIPVIGTVVDERGDWHVIIKWDDVPNVTTHWRQSLEIDTRPAAPAVPELWPRRRSGPA